jgi:hypothetical protein
VKIEGAFLLPLTTVCPICGTAVESVDTAHGEPTAPLAPEFTSVFMCIVCRGVSMLTARGLRLPTAEELADIRKDLAGDVGLEVKANMDAKRQRYRDEGRQVDL